MVTTIGQIHHLHSRNNLVKRFMSNLNDTYIHMYINITVTTIYLITFNIFAVEYALS